MSHHVKVCHSAEGCPVDGAGLYGLDPEVVGEDHAEDGDAFVVVRSGHGTGDVPGHNGNHGGGH